MNILNANQSLFIYCWQYERFRKFNDKIYLSCQTLIEFPIREWETVAACINMFSLEFIWSGHPFLFWAVSCQSIYEVWSLVYSDWFHSIYVSQTAVTIHHSKTLQLLVISLHTVYYIHILILRHKSRVRTTHIYLLILISRKGIKLRPKRIKQGYKSKKQTIITIHNRMVCAIVHGRSYIRYTFGPTNFSLLLNAISHIFIKRPVDNH